MAVFPPLAISYLTWLSNLGRIAHRKLTCCDPPNGPLKEIQIATAWHKHLVPSHMMYEVPHEASSRDYAYPTLSKNVL